MKFRVWDTENKKFNTTTDFFIAQNGKLWTMPMTDKYKVYKSNKNLIPVFYTGQSDKNGRDIYFNDIVKDKVGGHHSIEWDEEFSKLFLRVFENGARVDFLPSYELEIIGNKYENPELLRD